MSSLIPTLLDIILSLLEAFFASPPKTAADEHDGHDKAHQSEQEKCAALEAAFAFFQLTSEDATRDVASKKFRRLGLLHHPDRNGQSEESKQMMQKVNTYYTLITEELDRRDGIHQDEHYPEEDYPEDKDPAPPEPRPSKTTSKNQKRKAKRRQQRAQKHAQNMSRNEKEEMRKEREEIKRQQNQVRQTKKLYLKKIHQTVQTQNLNTQQGRDQAYQEWRDAMDIMEKYKEKERSKEKARTEWTRQENTPRSGLDDIDDHDVHVEPESSPEMPSEPEAIPVKPVNLVMECCTEDIVIALRMGLADAVVDSIQANIEKVIEKTVKDAILDGRRNVSKSIIMSAVANYFVKNLDEDGNTLLHYAVYYESLDVIEAIYYLSMTFEALPRIFLSENLRGMIPLDLAKCCCIKDSIVADRMNECTNAARAELERMQLWPSLKKSASRLWGIVRNMKAASVIRPANLIASYLIGTRLFGKRRITSILILAWTQWACDIAAHQFGYTSRLFGWHMAWCSTRYLFGIIPWMVYGLSIPVLILVLCFTSKATPKGELILKLVSLVFFPALTSILATLSYIEYQIKLPKAMKQGSELEKSGYMIIFTLGMLLIKNGIAWYWTLTKDGVSVANEEIA
jgi:curved DNA-binding protein CbpA